MNYGVKFCGGCNPRYDRGKLLRRLRERFKDVITFENADESQLYDGLIVLCGCTNCCAAYKSIQSKTDPILIWEDKQYDNIVEVLSKVKGEKC